MFIALEMIEVGRMELKLKQTKVLDNSQLYSEYQTIYPQD